MPLLFASYVNGQIRMGIVKAHPLRRHTRRHHRWFPGIRLHCGYAQRPAGEAETEGAGEANRKPVTTRPTRSSASKCMAMRTSPFECRRVPIRDRTEMGSQPRPGGERQEPAPPNDRRGGRPPHHGRHQGQHFHHGSRQQVPEGGARRHRSGDEAEPARRDFPQGVPQRTRPPAA